MSIVLLLVAMFPTTVLGSVPATMTIVSSQGGPPPVPVQLTESNIRSNATTLDITLFNNAWASSIGFPSNDALISTLKNSFSSIGATEVSTQWDLINTVPSTNFSLKNTSNPNDTIEITIPSSPTYDILSDQSVTFTPPASLLQDSSNIPALQSFTIAADPQATLSGSLTAGVTESNIVSGGRSLTIALVNCQWASDVATDATLRNTLFSALQDTTSPSLAIRSKWNTSVYNALIAAPDPSNVIKRDDNQTVTITLPQVPTYNIDVPQTVTLGESIGIDKSLLTDLNGIPYASPLPPNKIINNSFTINPVVTVASWNPSSAPSFTESNITSTGGALKMTLSNNTWAKDLDPTIVNDNTANKARQTSLMNGFTASSDEAAWNNVKAAILADTAHFALSTSTTTNDTLTITIPSTGGYSISTNQLVTLNIPSTVLTNNYPASNKLSFTITANPAVAISGTLTAGVNELDIVKGTKNIVATLYNATWDPSVTTDIAKREKLIDDLLPSSDATWTNAIATIKAGATYTLNNDSTVTITLPSVPQFNTSSPITISPLTPALTKADFQSLIVPSAGPLDIGSTSPSFTIAPLNNQSAFLNGTVKTASEPDIVAGSKTLVITLQNDIWAQDAVSNSTKLNALIDNIKTTSVTTWANVQTALKANPSNVVRTSDTVLTITLPPVSTYTIDTDQTIYVSIPSNSTSTSTQPIYAGSFTVKAVTVTLSGTAVTTPLNSSSVITGGKTLIITLKNATWASDVTTEGKLSNLLSCFSSSSSSVPTNWSRISSITTTQNITRSGNNVLTIKLPPIPNYTWDGTSEQVTFSINSSPSLFTKLINEAISSGKNLTALPKLQIGQTSQLVTASLSGSSMSVSDVVQGGKQITVNLTNGTWDPSFTRNSTKVNALVSGLTVNSDSTSWAMVQAALKSANLITNNPFALNSLNTQLTITLPSVPAYDPVNNQTISLTIPKTLLVPPSADIAANGQILISLPAYTSRGPLQSLLDDGSFTNYINTVPLAKIRLKVPPKHLTSVVSSQASIGNTTVNSLDCYTDNNVASVDVAVNGTDYISNTFVTYGNGRKFNVGFASSSPSYADTSISVLDSSNNSLQSVVPIKISGSKTYSLAPTPDLSGSYSLYRIVNNNSLLTNILKYYLPTDITLETP